VNATGRESAILSRPVDVAHLPPEGVDIVAGEREKTALATAYDLVAVQALSATAVLTPGPRGSVSVEGRVVADIMQTCVVSLVPVDQHIDEPFHLRFVRSADAPSVLRPGAEVVIEPSVEDPPEILDGPTIDVGAIVEETFVLAIDPYPRAPSARLPGDVLEPAVTDSPFAALAALAKPPAEKG